VILTGGSSRRMGADKCFLVHDGAPLVQRVADALDRAGAQTVRCVGGDLGRLRSLGLAAEPDAHAGEGPLGAVVQVLDATEPDELTAILAVDLLWPDPGAITELVAAAAAEPADVVLPDSAGHLQVLHGVWRRSAVAHLRAEFQSGVRSLTAAIAGLTTVRSMHQAPAGFLDADTPEQLRYAASDPKGRRGRR
jgi:molybdopterin-guanine dinucleotide biosynthesis protein A